MTLTTPKPATDLVDHKKTHLTMKDGLGCQPVKNGINYFSL